jgi:S1-C subfamily serine protease/predicted esterase
MLLAIPVQLVGMFLAHAQPDSLDEALEQATKAALDKVAPCVVQIRTIGGLEIVGSGVRKGQGPTTGVIVSPDGYIVSSTFNFASKPAAITVTLPNAKEPVNARVIAHDQTRMLTLLKVDASGLPTPTPIPKSEVLLGQWALAVGRTWSESPSSPPSVSVGIISAKDRIWGKALQTDAKVSPVNYGGPLIDLQGRVLGILVPLSPQRDDETAGVEWYDGGIGFAIPLEDVQRVLPKLKEGKDLIKGTLGIRMKSRDQFSAAPVIGEVAPESAAAKAGLLADDLIVEADGQPVVRFAQVQHILGTKYAGDRVSLKVQRGDKTLDLPNIELSGPPSSAVTSLLGILPMRDDGEAGVEVRYVFPKSPAQQAGIKAGDRILKLDTRPILARDQLLQGIGRIAPGVEVSLELKRKGGEKTETVKARLAELNDALPDDELPEGTLKKALTPPKPPMSPMLPMGVPRPMPPKKEEPAKKEDPKPEPKKGLFTKTDSATGHEYWAYVPENYDPNISHALIVWLHPAGDALTTDMQRLWPDLCKKHYLIFLAPKAENPTGWLTSEVDLIKGDIRELMAEYTIDRQRVVAHGLGNGGTLALYLGFDARDRIRGVAAFGGLLQNLPKDTSGPRLSFFLVGGTKDPAIEGIRAVKPQLAEKKFPVLYRELPDLGTGYVTDPGVLRELLRWIEGLDRI